ncbi:uncharacterized protein KZ484_018882 [Pholidichthys leucotaenia]
MRVCWMFVILLCSRSSFAFGSQNTCSCDCTEQLTIHRPTNDSVSVPVLCPNPDGDVVMFDLLKDRQVICKHNRTQGNQRQNCKAVPLVQLHLNSEKKFAGFTIKGATNSSDGIYRCKSTKTFPPPLVRLLGAPVLVEGLLNPSNKENNTWTKDKDGPKAFLWIWIMVTVLLGIYSITISAIALALWLKLRMTDSYSDYINTKPRAPRDRRKNGGNRNLITRHF